MPTTTIRLPKDFKDRVARAAERTGMTSHAFILDAILDHLHRYEVIDAPVRIEEIIQALSVLGIQPIGWPSNAG